MAEAEHRPKRCQQLAHALPSQVCLVFESPSSAAIAQFLDMRKGLCGMTAPQTTWPCKLSIIQVLQICSAAKGYVAGSTHARRRQICPPVRTLALERYDILTRNPCANGQRATPSRREKAHQRPSRESRPKTTPCEASRSKHATCGILKAELFFFEQDRKKVTTHTCRSFPQSSNAASVYSVKKAPAEEESNGLRQHL